VALVKGRRIFVAVADVVVVVVGIARTSAKVLFLARGVGRRNVKNDSFLFSSPTRSIRRVCNLPRPKSVPGGSLSLEQRVYPPQTRLFLEVKVLSRHTASSCCANSVAHLGVLAGVIKGSCGWTTKTKADRQQALRISTEHFGWVGNERVCLKLSAYYTPLLETG